MTSRMLAPGCRRITRMIAGSSIPPRDDAVVLDAVDDLGHVAEPHHRPIVLADDELLVGRGVEELAVRGDRQGLARAGDRALRLIHGGQAEGLAQVLHAQPHAGQRLGVDVDPHRRLLPSAHGHLSDPVDLGDLLREDRVGLVVNLPERDRPRGQRQDEDRRVGRVDLPVGGQRGQVVREDPGGGVDGGLHVAGGRVDVPVEVELQRDARSCPARSSRSSRRVRRCGRSAARAGWPPRRPWSRGWRQGARRSLRWWESRRVAAARPGSSV